MQPYVDSSQYAPVNTTLTEIETVTNATAATAAAITSNRDLALTYATNTQALIPLSPFLFGGF